MKKMEVFFFAVIFTANLAMLMQLIKTSNSPAFKRGLADSAHIMTKNVR